MKKLNYRIAIPVAAAALMTVYACSKSYLNVPVSGQLAPNTLATKPGVEALLIGAYSLLDGEGSNAGTGNGPWATAGSNWVYGSDAGGDAHKGSDPGDQNLIIPIEQWNASPSNSYLDQLWQQRYDGWQRANDVLRVMRLDVAGVNDLLPADTIAISAEAKFLRAHYAFELRKNFGKVPWIDESVTYTAGNFLIANDHDILPEIEADLTYAATNLPETQAQVARANSWAAKAYLAKAYMFDKKYDQALALFKDVIANGKTAKGEKYGLFANFRDAFAASKKNGMESVFAAQSTVNDGTGGSNANTGDGLNFPYGGQSSCCGFFQPSYSLANSYKTDPTTGLPMTSVLSSGDYNATDLKNDYGLKSSDAYSPDITTPVDPRLDWTVGRRGFAFLDWGLFPGQDWIRNQASAGPYEPIKNMFLASEKGTQTDASGWTPGFTGNNINLIRFSDVLLLAAEAYTLSSTPDLKAAEDLVDQVRGRAKTTQTVPQAFGGPTPNYKVGLYKDTYPGGFPTAAYALAAIQFERKLELAMEGHRFYDLSRWGIGDVELNAYAAHEVKSNYQILVGASYTKNKSEYLPIPQIEIDLSSKAGKSVLTQNPGY